MKYILCCILFLSMLFCTSCSNAPTANETVKFYYIYNDIKYSVQSGVITPFEFNSKGYSNDYTHLLEQYFNGPTNYECISPFPAGITLENFEITNERAVVQVSPHLATLSGINLTIAYACLSKTVIEMTDVSTVEIQINKSQINESISNTFTLSSFSYWDDWNQIKTTAEQQP